MKTILVIGAGGALGSMLRHLLNTAIAGWVRGPFPWGILAVNVLGCFAMGALVALFAGAWNVSQEARAFLTVGVLGGFTTFSAFALDTMGLWTVGDSKAALAYVSASVVLSIGGAFFGSFVVWKFIA